jgi:cytochrome P450
MFIAGHETTAFTLAWTLLLLAQHPRVLDALGAEVTGVLGDRAPETADAARMPLLDRVLKESQRLFPATPFVFIRRATAGFELGGHALPEGASIILSPLVTHRLPDVFPEPLRFLPERWERPAPSSFQYLPFGAGPRLCIGAGFANQALRLVLPMLLQRFRFELDPRADVSTKVRGITMGPARGVAMTALARDAKVTPVRRLRGNLDRLVSFEA